MTPFQKQIVKKSWADVAPAADQVAALFYHRLFEIDPSLRALFKSDMQAQGKKLMQTINVCVASLDRLEQVIPAVQALGMRHHEYEVEPRHYGTVAEALLWTLEQGLGPAFTEEVKDAWTEVYTTLAAVMQSAPHPVPA